MLKSWEDRGRGQDLQHIYQNLSTELAHMQEAGTRLLVPPPIQGLGAANGFQMQVQLTDGSYDFARLQEVTDRIVRNANATPEVEDAFTAFRANVPQLSLTVNRSQAATLNVDVGDVYNMLQSSLGSTYVNLFTRFGHNYMVYAQADGPYRLQPDSLKTYHVRSQSGDMIPLGTVAAITATQPRRSESEPFSGRYTYP